MSISEKILHAAAKDDLIKIESLIKKAKENNEIISTTWNYRSNNWYAMHYAAKNMNFPLIKTLQSIGYKLHGPKNKDGKTSADLLEIEIGDAILDYAKADNHQKVSELINQAKLHNVNIKIRQFISSKWNALHYAAHHQNPDMLQLLVDNGFRRTDKTASGNTPAIILGRAISSFTTTETIKQCVRIMVTNQRDTKNDKRFGLLLKVMLEHRNYDIESLKLIAETGTSLGWAKDITGWNSLHFAVWRGDDTECVSLVEKMLANPTQCENYINKTTVGGKTPFDIAFNYYSGLGSYELNINLLTTLVRHGAIVKRKQIDKLVEHGQWNTLKQIIEAIPNKRDNNDLFIHLIIKAIELKCDDQSFIQYLVSLNPDCNSLNPALQTLLTNSHSNQDETSEELNEESDNEELENERDRNRQLQNKLNTKETEAIALEENLKTSIFEQEKNIHDLHHKLEKQNTDIDNLQKAIGSLNETLGERENNLSKQHDLLKKFDTACDEQKQELDKRQTLIDKQSEELTTKNDMIDTLNNLKESNSQEIQTLKDLDTKKNIVVETLKDSLKKLKIISSEQEETINQLKNELKERGIINSSTHPEIMALKNSIMQLEQSLHESHCNIEEQQKTILKLQQTLDEKEINIQKQNKLLEQFDRTVEEQKRELDINAKTIESLKKENTQLVSDLKQANIDVNTAKLLLEQTESELEQTKQFNIDINQRLEQLKSSHLEMNQSLNNITNDNFELNEKNNELKQTNQQLQSELDSKNYVQEVTSLFSANTKSLLSNIGEDDEHDHTDTDSIYSENTFNILSSIDNEAEVDHRFHSNLPEDNLTTKKQPQLSLVSSPVKPITLLHNLIRNGNVEQLKREIGHQPLSVNRLDDNDTSPLFCALFDKGHKIKVGKNPIPQLILPSCRINIVKYLLEQPQLDLDRGSNDGTIINLLTGQMDTEKKPIEKTINPDVIKGDPKKLLYTMICQRYYANKICSEAAINDLHNNWQKLTSAKNQLTLIMSSRGKEVDKLIKEVEKESGRNFPKLYDRSDLSKEFNDTCALADTIYQAIMHNTCEGIKTCGIEKIANAEVYRVEHRCDKDQKTMPENLKSLKMIHKSLSEIFKSNGDINNFDAYWLAYREFIEYSFKILDQGYILLETQSFNHFQQHFLKLNLELRNELLGNQVDEQQEKQQNYFG